MKLLLTLAFTCLLTGCTKSDVKPQPTAKPSDCRVFRPTPEGKICMSEPALWLDECVRDLARRKQSNEAQWFNGIGANDVIFLPKTDPVEEIFQQCESVKPLSADKVPVYKKWLQDRILEIQSITPGTTRKKVNQILFQNGGIFVPIAITYSHKECDSLKVRIEFELVSNEHNGFSLNDDDKVKSVSMPYLGFFIGD